LAEKAASRNMQVKKYFKQNYEKEGEKL